MSHLAQTSAVIDDKTRHDSNSIRYSSHWSQVPHIAGASRPHGCTTQASTCFHALQVFRSKCSNMNLFLFLTSVALIAPESISISKLSISIESNRRSTCLDEYI